MPEFTSGNQKIVDMEIGATYLYDGSADGYSDGYEVVREEGTLTWLAFWEEDGKRRYDEVPGDGRHVFAVQMKDKSFELTKETIGDKLFNELSLHDGYETMLELYMEIDAKNSSVPDEHKDFGKYVKIG